MAAEVIPYDDAIRSEDQLLRLKAHALGAAVALVPAAVAGFLGVSRRGTIDGAVGFEAQDLDLSLAGVSERFVSSVDPFAPGRMPDSGATVLALDDLDARTTAYRWHLRTLGLHDRVTLYLRSAGTIVAAIALGRALDQPRFTGEETRSLRSIHALIERAYASAVEPRGDSSAALLLGAGLSAREIQVAELVGRGATNAEIARSLHLSEATVKTHLRHIYVKTGASSRTRLALLLGNRNEAAADA
jgi:DNA-binding CsgD family transcriptional regulator